MINRMKAFRVNFLAAILILLASFATGQTFKELGGTGQIANGLMARYSFLLPDDTVLTDAKNVDTCQQIAKKGGDIYSYSCQLHRWTKIVSGISSAIDSVRRSHDTLYFRKTSGGEIAVSMDYYTKSESDDRYVLSPKGKITANWLTAWDYVVAADVPNIASPDTKYLVVSGNQGDSILTVTGGTGMGDFTPNFAAVAFAKTPNRYFSFFVIRQAGSDYHIDRPLRHALVNDTIKFMHEAYQGQHLTDYGYRGYADMVYDYFKSLAAKDYKLYSFFPEDNPTTIPLTAIGGATHGGFIPSTTIPQLLGITTATINYSQIATVHYVVQQGGAAGKGVEWTANLGKKNGYLETWVGINRSLPGYARVLFYLDGVLKRVDTVRGAVQKLTYNYTNAASGKIQIITGDDQNTAIRIGRTIWYQTDLDTTSKVYTGGKIVFVGDSWTQFPIVGGVNKQAVTERFKERYAIDGGNTADIINVGRGGMTSVWGRYWFRYWLDLYKPKYVFIEFYINDSNSSSDYGNPSITTWNFSSTDPYSAGVDVDGKINQAGWLTNLFWMSDTAKGRNITPIHLMNTPTGSLTQTQGQSAWFSALRPAKQYYDIEAAFMSTVFADNSITTPIINATTGNIDTVISKETKGGTAVVNGSYFTELQSLNSSTTVAWDIYPKVTYTGSAGTIFRLRNNPTPNTGTVFQVRNNGTVIATDYTAGATGFNITPFSITYNAGIARISATNSTTVQDLYIGDSLTGVLRFRIPAVLANYTTSTLPTSSQRRVKGALVYDTDVDKAAVTNGFSWDYLAKESLVLARYDSVSAKNNFIRNSAAYANSPQTADILNVGTMRNDGPFIVNGSVRLNLGSDLKWDMWARDSATGNMIRIPASTFGYTLKAGPGGKPEWIDQAGHFIRNQQASVQTADYNISGNAIANKFMSAAGTSGGAMTHFTMASTAFFNRITFDLTGTESGSNAGSNLQFNRWSDASTSLGAGFFMRRADGFVGIGTTSPRYKLDVSGGVAYGDGIGTSIVTKNTNNTASITNETVLNCTASITQTLPDAVSGNYGKIFIINKDYAGGAVTIASNSIDGATTYTLTDTLQSVTVISSGVSWRVIATKISSSGYRHTTSTLAQVTTAGNTTTNSITVGDVTTSNATAYSSGGITAIGRNNTSGRLETFTAGGVIALKDFYTDQGNTSTSVGITNALYTYSIPANRLSAVGEKITAVFGGTFATNGNTKSLGVGFGIHANIGSNSVTLNGVGWVVKVTIIRINTNTVRAIVEVPGVDAVVGEYTSIDFTVANDLVLSGSGGGAVNDVVAKMGSVKWETAAP